MGKDGQPRAKTFQELKNRGIAKVVVSFSGGGDEGGADGLDVLDANGNTMDEVLLEAYEGAIGEALVKPIHERYYSFAGEFYVSGECVWDVEKEKIYIHGQESVEHWESFDEEA